MKKMLINDEGSKKMVYLAAKMNREENVITACTDWGMDCETLDALVNKLFVAIAKECADSDFSANVDFSDCYDEKAYEIRYADGNLVAAEHVYRDYLYTKLLYEEMTRAREKLCVIVEDNYPLFENILSYFD